MSQEVLAGSPAYKKPRFTLRRMESLMGYLLVTPLLACVLILVIYPFLFAIWISFTDRMVGGGPGEFIGLGNFIYLFNQVSFLQTVRNTFVLVGAVQISKLLIGLGIATLLNQGIRFRRFWRSLILLPWAMPGFVAFITWRFLYQPEGGAFNFILISLGLVDTHVAFLSTRELALPSVVVALVWRGFPFWVITFLAALQTVPKELYEAAALDGASAWQRFLNVSLPGIRHIVLVVVLVSTIATTNSFEAIFLMTAGGPSNATMTFPVFAYFGLQNLRLGEAAAVGVSLLPVFASLAFVTAKLLQQED